MSCSYALVDRSGGLNLADLRALQDFNLRYALESVEGVAEVASVGGFVREYQINLDPNKLASYDIALGKVIDAVCASNNDVGGRALEIAGHEHFIRGRGYVKSTEDLEQVVIGLGEGGVPVTVADVGFVSRGPAMQRGQAELDGQGVAVGGIVVMRYGEDALSVIERVKLSVAVWVGAIAVAGLAVELGLLMMLYLDISYRRRETEGRLVEPDALRDVIVEGAGQRIRPMLMTGLALFMGLVPVMISTGTGADVMKRIAAPMLGGIATALLMVLVVFPAIFAIWRGRSRDLAAPPPMHSTTT